MLAYQNGMASVFAKKLDDFNGSLGSRDDNDRTGVLTYIDSYMEGGSLDDKDWIAPTLRRLSR
jgi:hypothetical protein